MPVYERDVGQIKHDRGARRHHLFDLVVKPIDRRSVVLPVQRHHPYPTLQLDLDIAVRAHP